VLDFFLPKDYESWDEETFRRARVTTLTSLLAATTTLVIFLLRVISAGGFLFIHIFSVTGLLLFLSIPFYLKFTGSFRGASALLIFSSIGMFFSISYFTSGVFTAILHPLFLVAMVSFLMGSVWLGWFAVGMSSFCVLFLSFLHFQGKTFTNTHGPTEAGLTALTFVSAFLICGAVMHYFELDRKKGRKKILDILGELAKARQEAISANEMKSSFLANMSHELRTPLNAIIGYAEMLEEDLDDAGEKQQVEDVQKIHNSARHLLGLLNDLLDISKVEAGKIELFIEAFDVVELSQEIFDSILPLAQKNDNTLELEVELSEQRILTADVLRVRQILFNLLSNACKFTSKGIVTLRIERVKELFLLQVRDTGIGMTQEQQDKLFQPFQQADAKIAQKFGGTGLGLYISQQFCHLMKGRISLESEEGKGSTFSVFLPAVVSSEQT